MIEKCIYVKVDKLLRQNFNDARNRAVIKLVVQIWVRDNRWEISKGRPLIHRASSLAQGSQSRSARQIARDCWRSGNLSRPPQPSRTSAFRKYRTFVDALREFRLGISRENMRNGSTARITELSSCSLLHVHWTSNGLARVAEKQEIRANGAPGYIGFLFGFLDGWIGVGGVPPAKPLRSYQCGKSPLGSLGGSARFSRDSSVSLYSIPGQ